MNRNKLLLFKINQLNCLKSNYCTTISAFASARRVVVTGLGSLNSLGANVNDSWTNLLDGKIGIHRLDETQYDQIPCKIAATISNDKLNLDDNFTASELKTLSRNSLLTLLASKEAINDSNLDLQSNEIDLNRFGCAIGTGMIDLTDTSESILTFKQKGYKKLNPHFVTKLLLNMPAGHVSIKFKLKGPNHCVSTACASGAHAIGDSFNFIRFNFADRMICGGSECSINPISIAGFARIRALATKFNENPQQASRPFDEARNGFVMGEGAGILILEELEHARKRNAKIYAEILGYGLSADAFHITSPNGDGDGAFNSMNNALASANLKPKSITNINCHATSTPLGDEIELKAIKRLFKEENSLSNLFITSNKGSIGHLLGAAGAVESIFTILSCYHSLIPLTVNLDRSIDSNLNIVNKKNFKWTLPNRLDRRIAIKNSFGFGGTNATLVISEFKN